ncbi:MAG: Chemotaxis protein CheY [Ignavibacteria bacterium]|nr:Chemotaxis protein CheY [Ignavibacteria bacterium]
MKKKILIIDDDSDIIEALKLFLEAKGYEVKGETKPSKAIELFNSFKPDLAILDVMMDEPDEGFFIAQKIKKINPSCPLIIYSSISKALGYDFAKSEVIVAEDFVDKPADPNVLLDLLNKYLGGSNYD